MENAPKVSIEILHDEAFNYDWHLFETIRETIKSRTKTEGGERTAGDTALG